MTAWPLVKARLIATLPGLTGWSDVQVFSGPPVASTTPPDYVTVGYVFGEDMAGSFEKTRGIGDIDDEIGSLRSEIVCSTGRADIAAVEARAFALADAFLAWIDADRTLGVLLPGSTATAAVDVLPLQSSDGASQRLVVTLNYTARA